MAFYGSDLISVGSIRELFHQRRNVEVMTSTEELQETVANKFMQMQVSVSQSMTRTFTQLSKITYLSSVQIYNLRYKNFWLQKVMNSPKSDISALWSLFWTPQSTKDGHRLAQVQRRATKMISKGSRTLPMRKDKRSSVVSPSRRLLRVTSSQYSTA